APASSWRAASRDQPPEAAPDRLAVLRADLRPRLPERADRGVRVPRARPRRRNRRPPDGLDRARRPLRRVRRDDARGPAARRATWGGPRLLGPADRAARAPTLPAGSSGPAGGGRRG